MRLFIYIFLKLLFANLVIAQMPANIYADSTHAPFYYGVCSGDPTDSSVIIWTHITPTSPDSVSVTVNWQISPDTTFNTILYSGLATSDSLLNYTIKIDVSGLAAGSTYYYRFSDNDSNYSVWGRAKTLPIGNVNNTKIAVMSCSSIFSGFFNAYKRLSEREDLQLLIHLGDYIYDYPDADELVRIPNPFPVDCESKEDWVERHKYYLLDPDLREARRMQTWYAYWDNHDIDSDSLYAKEIFRQWLPIRETAQVQQNLLYRSLAIGNLADIMMLDVESLRNIDTFPNGEYNLMGHTQFEWATDNLKNSTSLWRIMGSQKMAGGWYTRGIDAGILNLVPNDGDVFDNGSWDGFMETRNRLFDTLVQYNINNCLMLSGDAHITLAMDLVKDPYDSIAYNPSTGSGAVGCEFLASSISRGNFDEAGVPASLSPFFISITMGANPHHQNMEINSHGYGIIEINEDSIVATPFYSDILNITNVESAGQSMIMKNGENHWKRLPLSVYEVKNLHQWTLYPNPAKNTINLDLPFNFSELKAIIFDNLGRELRQEKLYGNNTISIERLENGFYWLKLEQNGNTLGVKKFQIFR